MKKAPISKTRAPSTARTTESIRKDYLGGDVRPNSFLPGERELAGRYGVARITIRRALQQLASEGLVRAEAGRGYRALMRIARVKNGSPAAFIVSKPQRDWTYTMNEVASFFQRQLVEDDWLTLSVSTENRTSQELLTTLSQAKVWGAALDTPHEWVFKSVFESGLPCVSVDNLCSCVPIDSILQDNHGGGMQAAQFLIERGHTRIAWLGDIKESLHSLERYSGATCAFIRAGRQMPTEYTLSHPDYWNQQAIREMLTRHDRPTAILSLWSDLTISTCRIARDLGLVPGRDLDIIGWSTEEGYRAHIQQQLGTASSPPPTIVWSTAEMARTAITRLLWHIREPGLKPLRVSIPTRLVLSPQTLEKTITQK
jgi:DNA-binding LacI/PurR family transcriptional regulator